MFDEEQYFQEFIKALKQYKKKYGNPFSEEIVQHFMRQIIGAFKYIIIKKQLKMQQTSYQREQEQEFITK